MGNNTSTTNVSSPNSKRQSGTSDSIRKSSASANYNKDSINDNKVRKSSASKNVNSLDEEFSDLILHQVVKKPSNAHLQSQQLGSQPSNPSTYEQLTNDLIEDDLNELNEGLVEESTSLQRNIIPDSGFENDVDNSMSTDTSSGTIDSTLSDDMDIDGPFHHEDHNGDDVNDEPMNSQIGNRSETPTPDLSKVDFTKITNQKPPTFDSRAQPQPLAPPPPPPATTKMSAASVARSVHSPSPILDHQKYLQPNHRQQQQHVQSSSPENYHYVSNNNSNHGGHHRQHKMSKTDKQQILIPIEIKWVNSAKEPINKISIIGSFSNWRDVIKMYPSTSHPNEFVTTINLPLGVHKLLYIINNEYRVSDQLPTATDQEGIFFNWFEVIDDTHLFNHSSNQPNHIGASTDYDANIIKYEDDPTTPYHYQQDLPPRPAGKHDVDRIQQKSNELLQKISKEGSSEFAHVEFIEDAGFDNQQQPQQQQQNHSPYGTSFDNSPYQPYDLPSNSNSFLNGSQADLEPAKEYSSEIPEMFINYDYFKMKPENYELPEPPQLPPHLNNVLLNKISSSSSSQGSIPPYHNTNQPGHMPSNFPATSGPGSASTYSSKRPPLRRADSSYYASSKEAYHLQIPNHVILNHLMTTSIKNDVLTVACITRYSGKFVTQIMHSPADQ
ncbi:hypothetical protein G210_3647, partial [Candida maltosa Xu316]